MITEDYVSFETAKLLKEKGFDEICSAIWRYWEDGIGEPCFINSLSIVDERGYPYCYNSRLKKKSENDGEIDIACPTLQMAMKWLRETHNIDISVVPHSHKDYEFVYWNGGEYHMPYDEKRPTYHELFGKTWEKYEEACEAAIKYCLEKLI